jgi:hypothetical protein
MSEDLHGGQPRERGAVQVDALAQVRGRVVGRARLRRRLRLRPPRRQRHVQDVARHVRVVLHATTLALWYTQHHVKLYKTVKLYQ